jgi:hypothetical protein
MSKALNCCAAVWLALGTLRVGAATIITAQETWDTGAEGWLQDLESQPDRRRPRESQG